MPLMRTTASSTKVSVSNESRYVVRPEMRDQSSANKGSVSFSGFSVSAIFSRTFTTRPVKLVPVSRSISS